MKGERWRWSQVKSKWQQVRGRKMGKLFHHWKARVEKLCSQDSEVRFIQINQYFLIRTWKLREFNGCLLSLHFTLLFRNWAFFKHSTTIKTIHSGDIQLKTGINIASWWRLVTMCRYTLETVDWHCSYNTDNTDYIIHKTMLFTRPG